MCQLWCRNRSLQEDAYLAILECVGLRPGTVMNTEDDLKDPFSAFHDKSPLRLGNLLARQNCLGEDGQGRLLPSGETSKLTCTLDIGTNKQKRHESVKFACTLTANAATLPRCASYRLMRLQIVRGVFRAVHERLEKEQSDKLYTWMKDAEFRGVELWDIGFTCWNEVAEACLADNFVAS